MKFTKTLLASAIAFTIAQANANDWTVNAVIKNETAMFTTSGSVNGDRGTQTTTGTGATYLGVTTADTPTHDSGDVMKSETSARIFVNGQLSDNAALHAELRPVVDTEGANDDYKRHQSYTQQDYLRELYVDTSINDVNVRIGKQQVVWGTADGMKLLDIINPTDYREMAQNSMEESRVPVWMINAEKYLDNGDSIQMILSEPRENVFAGLNRNTSTAVRSNTQTAYGDDDATLNNGTDTGHAFKLLGPDSITGEYNGFLNITPDMGSIAGRFAGAFNYMLSDTTNTDGDSDGIVDGVTWAALGGTSGGTYYGKAAAMHDTRMMGFTVDGFEVMQMGGATGSEGSGVMSMTSALAANDMIIDAGGSTYADNHFYYLPGGIGSYEASSLDPADWTGFAKAVYNVAANMADTLGYSYTGTNAQGSWADDFARGDSVNASDAAFQAAREWADENITGQHMLAYGFAPLYNTNLADTDSIQDTAFDYMGSATFLTFDTFGGAKSQYVYNMPKETELDGAFRYATHFDNGVNLAAAYSYSYDKNPIINLSWRDSSGNLLYTHRVVSDGSGGVTADDATVADDQTESILVTNSTSNNYGVAYGDSSSGVTSYGSSTGNAPILRFEQTTVRTHNIGVATDFSIDTESMGPVVIRGEFLYQKDSRQPIIDKDYLSIGDLTGALTMEKADRFKYVIGADVTVMTDMMVSAQFIQDRNLDFVDGANRYTASYANMHLSNGFKKDFENKEFYSLFFSKPFGESGEGRWNNITMLEEGGGRWNRFDVEYSLSNELVGTLEFNKYWGDANSQFGQLENTSNVQVGLKYIIE